jgi:membrane protein DedA with SNARE-associated domain
VSPSKKANKTAASEGLRAAQGKSAQRSARHNSGLSSRVSAKEPEETILTEIVQPKTYNKPGSSRFLTNILRVLALFAVVGITLFFYSIRDRIDELQQWGYPGVFLIALLANATVLLPAPGVAVIYAMGAIFSNPFGVGLAAGLGGTVGELSGYLAGFSGQAVVERMDIYNRIKPWVDKYGGWAILVLSAIPNPFFDIAGIAAGIAKMPLRTFIIFSGIGQLIKMTTFALAGHYSVSFLSTFFE